MTNIQRSLAIHNYVGYLKATFADPLCHRVTYGLANLVERNVSALPTDREGISFGVFLNGQSGGVIESVPIENMIPPDLYSILLSRPKGIEGGIICHSAMIIPSLWGDSSLVVDGLEYFGVRTYRVPEFLSNQVKRNDVFEIPQISWAKYFTGK